MNYFLPFKLNQLISSQWTTFAIHFTHPSNPNVPTPLAYEKCWHFPATPSFHPGWFHFSRTSRWLFFMFCLHTTKPPFLASLPSHSLFAHCFFPPYASCSFAPKPQRVYGSRGQAHSGKADGGKLANSKSGRNKICHIRAARMAVPAGHPNGTWVIMVWQTVVQTKATAEAQRRRWRRMRTTTMMMMMMGASREWKTGKFYYIITVASFNYFSFFVCVFALLSCPPV